MSLFPKFPNSSTRGICFILFFLLVSLWVPEAVWERLAKFIYFTEFCFTHEPPGWEITCEINFFSPPFFLSLKFCSFLCQRSLWCRSLVITQTHFLLSQFPIFFLSPLPSSSPLLLSERLLFRFSVVPNFLFIAIPSSKQQQPPVLGKKASPIDETRVKPIGAQLFPWRVEMLLQYFLKTSSAAKHHHDAATSAPPSWAAVFRPGSFPHLHPNVLKRLWHAYQWNATSQRKYVYI